MRRGSPSCSNPCIVNVGLPRTGTTSFSRATELLGFRSRHVWYRAEHNPELLARFKANDPECRAFISQFHTLSDAPFFALRDTFERYYPDTLILFTTRPKAGWIRSMLNYNTAGGKILAGLYGLQNFPYSERDAAALERVYEQHHANICRGLPSIDIGVHDDRAKWELLCSALPNPEKCLELSKQHPWPHQNKFQE